MFTVCPKCALTLVVTAADLRVAQGYVRCGRCSSVFNALARLTDERHATAASGEPDLASAAEPDLASAAEPDLASAAEPDLASAAEPDPASAAEPGPAAAEAAGGAQPPGEPAGGTVETSASAIEAEVIPEAALEFNPARIDVTALFVEPEPDPQWTAATGSFKAMIAANQEGAVGEQPQAQAAPAPAAPTAAPGGHGRRGGGRCGVSRPVAERRGSRTPARCRARRCGLAHGPGSPAGTKRGDAREPTPAAAGDTTPAAPAGSGRPAVARSPRAATAGARRAAGGR